MLNSKEIQENIKEIRTKKREIPRKYEKTRKIPRKYKEDNRERSSGKRRKLI